MLRAILVAAFALLLAAPAAFGSPGVQPRGDGEEGSAKVAICKVFGTYCSQASPFLCESALSVWAPATASTSGCSRWGHARAPYGHHDSKLGPGPRGLALLRRLRAGLESLGVQTLVIPR